MFEILISLDLLRLTTVRFSSYFDLRFFGFRDNNTNPTDYVLYFYLIHCTPFLATRQLKH